MKNPDLLDERAQALRDLQAIPGIGPSLASDLFGLGIRRVADLKRKSPETLYHRLERQTGSRQDPCVLYAFRCAVYFATTSRPRPRLLLWWNWKAAPPFQADKSKQGGRDQQRGGTRLRNRRESVADHVQPRQLVRAQVHLHTR